MALYTNKDESVFFLVPKSKESALQQIGLNTDALHAHNKPTINGSKKFTVNSLIDLFMSKKHYSKTSKQSMWFIVGHGESKKSICGMPSAEFCTLLQELNTKTFTRLLYIRSCFARASVPEVLQKLQSSLEFPLIFEGVDDVPVEAETRDLWGESTSVHYDSFAQLTCTEEQPLYISILKAITPGIPTSAEHFLKSSQVPQIIHPSRLNATPLIPHACITSVQAHTRRSPLIIATSLKNQFWKKIFAHPFANKNKIKAYSDIYPKIVLIDTPYVPFTIDLREFNSMHSIRELFVAPHNQHIADFAIESLQITENECFSPFIPHNAKGQEKRGHSVRFYIKRMIVHSKSAQHMLHNVIIEQKTTTQNGFDYFRKPITYNATQLIVTGIFNEKCGELNTHINLHKDVSEQIDPEAHNARFEAGYAKCREQWEKAGGYGRYADIERLLNKRSNRKNNHNSEIDPGDWCPIL